MPQPFPEKDGRSAEYDRIGGSRVSGSDVSTSPAAAGGFCFPCVAGHALGGARVPGGLQGAGQVRGRSYRSPFWLLGCFCWFVVGCFWLFCFVLVGPG